MQFPAPPVPTFLPEYAHVAAGHLRYEDVAQDGRVMPIALAHGMGAVWHLLRDHPGHRASIASGVIPILTRMTLTSLDVPIRVDEGVEARAGFELTRGDGRLHMNLWADLYGAAGRIGPRPPGPLVHAGGVFAEHTFTRLFAPPGQRAVTRLEAPGYPELPEASHAAQAPATAGEAPAGAAWLDELTEDPAEVAFTLDQTDSNQHVNSLVYIRIFLDAVQRRFAAGGYPLKVRSKAVDIAYRKPCFAGDRVRAHVRLFEGGAAGFIAAATDERPRCYVRILAGP